MGKLFLSSHVLLLCAIYLTKVSVLFFERRIFSGSKKQNKRIFDAVIAATGVCGIASVIAISAGCDFGVAFTSPADSCPSAVSHSTTYVRLLN